jgi:hypothetical protein
MQCLDCDRPDPLKSTEAKARSVGTTVKRRVETHTAWRPVVSTKGATHGVNHAASLKQALESAEIYIGLAIKSRERAEREPFEEIAEPI